MFKRIWRAIKAYFNPSIPKIESKVENENYYVPLQEDVCVKNDNDIKKQFIIDVSPLNEIHNEIPQSDVIVNLTETLKERNEIMKEVDKVFGDEKTKPIKSQTNPVKKSNQPTKKVNVKKGAVKNDGKQGQKKTAPKKSDAGKNKGQSKKTR